MCIMYYDGQLTQYSHHHSPHPKMPFIPPSQYTYTSLPIPSPRVYLSYTVDGSLWCLAFCISFAPK